MKPTTTLAAETANNTSASSSYNLTSTGNARPGNVSKHPMRSLLYGGSTSKIYAQLQGWWGPTSHIQIGYWSNDPSQVTRQVDDAVSRGIQGFILDWYGPTAAWPTNETAFLLKAEAERHSGFTFAVQEDNGPLRECRSKSGCDVTGLLISHPQYAYYNFELSPAYQRIDGRPVVYFFDVGWPTIDWARVRDSIPGNPLLIEHYDGIYYNPFALWYYDGAYSWVRINSSDPDDWGGSYLQTFYETAQSSAIHIVGASFKGFDDRLASWSGNRVMNQNCGRTRMNTWGQVNAMYNSSRQLEAIQIGTWNDYEEGTEIETGIDPCLVMNASFSGSTLSFWPSGAGSESRAVAYYSIFVSKDGQNLMKLADVSAGVHSINLEGYDFTPGTYYFNIKMQSKPGFHTRMSAPVSATFGTAPEPTYTFTAGRPALSVAPGSSASVTLSFTSTNYAGVVTIAASADSGAISAGAPPVTLTQGGNTTSTLTITTSPSAANQPARRPWRGKGMLVVFCAALLGTSLRPRGKRACKLLFFAFALALLGALVACGGGSQEATRTYAVVVAATGSGSVTNPSPVTITVSVQ